MPTLVESLAAFLSGSKLQSLLFENGTGYSQHISLIIPEMGELALKNHSVQCCQRCTPMQGYLGGSEEGSKGMDLVLQALSSLKIELAVPFCIIGKMIHNQNSPQTGCSGTAISLCILTLSALRGSCPSSSKLMFRLQVPRAAQDASESLAEVPQPAGFDFLV